MKLSEANIGDVLLFNQTHYSTVAYRLISPIIDTLARLIPVYSNIDGVFIPCGQVCECAWDVDVIMVEEPFFRIPEPLLLPLLQKTLEEIVAT